MDSVSTHVAYLPECVSGRGHRAGVRRHCLLQIWLERDGWVSGHRLAGGHAHERGAGAASKDLWNPPGVQARQGAQATQSDQQSPGAQAGRPDFTLLTQTNWQHCAHLLYILHYLRNLRSPGECLSLRYAQLEAIQFPCLQ